MDMENQNGPLRNFFNKPEIQKLILLIFFSLILILIEFFFHIPNFDILLKSEKVFDVVKQFIANKSCVYFK